jgi:L-fuculose-phosphate aldolase
MTTPWKAERQAVVETAQEMWRLGLVAGSSGNVSVRLSADPPLFAITPSHRPYASLRWQDAVVVDRVGDTVEGNLAPSSELLLHLGVYAARGDAGAVVHCHSVYASVCAVAGLEVPPIVDELVLLVGGAIRVADYAFPGTDELGANACRALVERKAALLRNHGMVALGRDLAEALELCALVERAAHIFVTARLLGGAQTLPPEVVAAEAEMFRTRERRDTEP